MKLCFTKVLGDVRAAFLSKSKEPGMSIHLLQRITDVTRRSRWAHFAEITDLHLADLRRQAEEHHRDRKPVPFSKKGRLPRTLCDVQAVLAAGVQQDCEQ